MGRGRAVRDFGMKGWPEVKGLAGNSLGGRDSIVTELDVPAWRIDILSGNAFSQG
jgi:hypothetical protein